MDIFEAKVIVGAGGHHDIVRRTGWSEKSLNIPVKFAIKKGVHTEALELHFGAIAPGGYAWVFPKNGSSNIGIGIQPKFARGTSLNILAKQFIDSYSGDLEYEGAGALPMSGTIRASSMENTYSWAIQQDGTSFQRCGDNNSNDWRQNRRECNRRPSTGWSTSRILRA